MRPLFDRYELRTTVWRILQYVAYRTVPHPLDAARLVEQHACYD